MTANTSMATSASKRIAVSSRRYLSEAAGTFLLVFGVVGTAVLDAGDMKAHGSNVGFLGVALALGLSVLVGAYAFGPVSGGHFNPAVTVGLALSGRFPWTLVGGYIAAQVVGGLLASSVIVGIAAGGPPGFLAESQDAGFASTGWGPLSPGGYSWWAAFLVEVVTTAILTAVVIVVTDKSRYAAVAPLAIGLTLTVVALVAIPVSNGSFNPARSIATAVYGGPIALSELWLSIVAPLLGSAVVGVFTAVTLRRRRLST
ncbi:aquaporin [Leifsonia sp. 22587]|uniref:aquaporin n=1 Tax=Leifsonia sp. 22587 TaxID=3453946 RepID=UPI003F876066